MIGVIIGRFQVDEMHEGHLKLLKFVQQQHERVVILLGCKHSPADRNNPLSFSAREVMLRPYVGDATVLPVFDQPDDVTWSAHVDSMIGGAFPNVSATLYGGRDSFIPHYHGRYATRELDFGEANAGSARRKLLGERVSNTPEFRAGVIHALETLTPRIFLTVDIAVWNPAGELLLGRKRNEVLWRLPGGFVDHGDPDLESAARRELFEETKLTVNGGLHYQGSYTIDDWRSRGAPDCKHLTALFEATGVWGAPVGSDDLAEVEFRIPKLHTIVPAHQPLVLAFKERPACT